MSRILSAIAKFLTSRGDDAVRLQGDYVHFKEAGSSGSLSLEEIRNTTVEQSFLGIFGSSISIKSSNGSTHLIKGLEHEQAVVLKFQIDEERERIAIINATKTLHRYNPRIIAAYQELTFRDYFSSNRMTQWFDEYGDLFFLKQISEKILKAADSTAACEFRSKLDTDSTANWTLIPRQTGH